MQEFFYNRTTKQIIVALSSAFNNMKIYKYDTSDIPTSPDISAYTSASGIQEINVPLTFGPVEKIYQNRIEDHEYIASASDSYGYTQVEAHGQRYQLQLPRMALILNGIAYNASRAYGVNEWREWFTESLELYGSDTESIIRDYAPAPYDFNFTLEVWTNSLDYFAQIMENILPYFNPKMMLRIKEFSFLNIERDLPVSLNGVAPNFISEELDDSSRREIKATLELTVEGWMYRKWETSKLIKIINSKYFISDASGNVNISATNYETSGVQLTSGTLPTSGVPELYILSGVDNNTAWFKDIIN